MKILRERIYKLTHEKNSLQRFLLRRYLFAPLQRIFGISVTANHFYEPIPDLKRIKTNGTAKVPPASLGWSFPELEADFLDSFNKYGFEFEQSAGAFGYESNYYFREFDALCLYLFLRSRKILSVVEFGQGYSSRVSAAALEQNSKELNTAYTFTSIDPYSRVSSQGNSNIPGKTNLIQKCAQDFSSEEINTMLGRNGLLFVDSSHVYKSGSDVEHLFCEIYPNLTSGSYLHIHDIYLPYPWPTENLIENKWFWNEHDFLFHFLSFNRSFELLLPAYWLSKDSLLLPGVMGEVCSKFCKEGYSIYLKKVEQADAPST